MTRGGVPPDGGHESLRRFVAAVLIRGRAALLVRRSPQRVWYPNRWDLPGGAAEAGESEIGALSREIDEELGVAIEAAGLSQLARLSDPESHVELSVWRVPRWSGSPWNRAPGEHSELRWVEARELPGLELAHPEYEPLLTGELARLGDDD